MDELEAFKQILSEEEFNHYPGSNIISMLEENRYIERIGARSFRVLKNFRINYHGFSEPYNKKLSFNTNSIIYDW